MPADKSKENEVIPDVVVAVCESPKQKIKEPTNKKSVIVMQSLFGEYDINPIKIDFLHKEKKNPKVPKYLRSVS